MKRLLCLLLCVSICSSLARPVKAATEDYLNITLADIIIAWYNASGVAIGDTNLANAIYDAYGSITIDDLVEHDCLFAMDVVLPPNSPEMRDYVRQLIGYGNLTVPMIAVSVSHLQSYLSGLPVSDIARRSLEAMFGWEGNLYNEVMFSLLGLAIGSVANIGKIGYRLVTDTIADVSDIVKNSYMGKTLLDVYRHFTDTTYFQDLLSEGITVTPSPGAGESDITLNFDAGSYAGTGAIGNSSRIYCYRFPAHVYAYIEYAGTKTNYYIYNNNSTAFEYQFREGTYSSSSNTITPANDDYWHTDGISGNSLKLFTYYASSSNVTGVYNVGYALKDSSVPFQNKTAIKTYCIENDPWNPSSTTLPGVTKYINNAVGNILSDNYLNLSPNIGSDEYMYIFDRPLYIETLNQITNNTDNGDYSNNSTVINNFNETNIEEPSYVTVRPSTAPADPDQPAQPFISPRPTQAPDSYEGVIYEGGISEEITKKFPFCIPWDIKAMIDRLWTPESRAPYIHWDANFGSWGKLGEVDIDLQDFNGVAAIFRATTLLLWIVWLVTITRDLLG